MSTCEQCGRELIKRTLGRPQTKFCSRKCKDDHRTAEQSKVIAAARIGRVCAECNGQIPEDVNLRAKTCSRECGVKYQNRRKQEGKRAAWLARKPPCRRCDGEIPESRPAGSMYCSERCKHNELSARWRERAPGYMRLRNYGVTPERYAAMLSAQGDRCAICRTDTPAGKGSWHVDHCHDSKKVRGLLCHYCNLALGNFKDNIDSLRAAIDYLMAAESLPEAPLTLR